MKAHFDFYNQWTPLFQPGPRNWIDFTFISLGVEWSPYKASCEVSFMFVGLGGCLTLDWRDKASQETLGVDPK